MMLLEYTWYRKMCRELCYDVKQKCKAFICCNPKFVWIYIALVKAGKKHSEMLKVLGVVKLPMNFSCLYIFLFPKYFPLRMLLFQNTFCSFYMHASASGQLETHCIEFMVIAKWDGPIFFGAETRTDSERNFKAFMSRLGKRIPQLPFLIA